MIKIFPTLEIERIEKIRKEWQGSGLNERDSLCCHVILEIDEKDKGSLRYYKRKAAIVIDCLAIANTLSVEYKEMLLRAAISAAMDIAIEEVVVEEEEPAVLLQMGFVGQSGVYCARIENIKFPCRCNK